MQKFDLHTHTIMSDGTNSPEQLVSLAKQAELAFVAVTDHDTVSGVLRAQEAGKRFSQRVVAGVELDVDFHTTLHILGLGINTDSNKLLSLLETSAKRRAERNEKIKTLLRKNNMPIDDYMPKVDGNVTKTHLALALIAAGYVKTTGEAFNKTFAPGGVAWVESVRPSIFEAIDVIHSAGGIAVVAHPCKIKSEPHGLMRLLVQHGIDGIEAFYPTSTRGERELFLSLAAQYGLLVTAGSDFHGENRPEAALGKGYMLHESLRDVYKRFISNG